jgi:predicted DNA-binding protein (MmcQ/YjbR family)
MRNDVPKKTPLDHMRDICLALPDTTETPTWGQPHFRVKNKIFAGCGEHQGALTIGCKLEMEHADILIQNDPRVMRAPYVGHKGWISIDAAKLKSADWDWIRSLVHESYRLIAPKKTLAKWQQEPGDDDMLGER